MVSMLDAVFVQEPGPGFFVAGGCEARELFECHIERDAIAESAMNCQGINILPGGITILDQAFAMPDAVVVDKGVEIEPYLPIEE